MQIAIDVRDADGERTGKGFYAYGLISEILSADQENQYILYSDKEKSPFKELPNVTFKHLPFQGLKWHLEALKDLKKTRPDLYFAPTSFIIPALAPRWLRTIITVHDLVSFLFPTNHSRKAVFVERLTLKKALSKVSKVFVVSENTQNDLVKVFKFPKSTILEVPCAPHDRYKNPVSDQDLQKIREKFKLPEKFIFAVGTLEPRKNFVTLVKAFANVKRKFPDYKLVIAGKQGWKYQDIYRAIKEFKLTEDVILPGYLKEDELQIMYHLASVFVFPSLYEGFGIPPLEAMACGCPVVASNAASLPEVIGDGGLLVDPRSSVKLAEAIIDLIENPQVRSLLIERGYKRSLYFTWQESARLALAAFKELKRD
ncbi:MAG: glycosyltransferase family 4 protein [Candidatus Altimarinota bacterium]